MGEQADSEKFFDAVDSTVSDSHGFHICRPS